MRVVGTGTRVLNFLVDMAIVSSLAFGIYRGWTFYVFYYHILFIPIYYFLVLTGFFYYLIFESIWRRTPGKWLSLSKVVNKQGGKPSFFQILFRSTIRVFGIIIIDCIFISFMDITLHDYLSQTVVIEV